MEIMSFMWVAYVLGVVAIFVDVLVLIRLMVSATRALDAYTENTKLRTALALDGVIPADGSRVP